MPRKLDCIRAQQPSAPFSAIIMDALTDGIRTNTPWQMMFADDVVLCATDKYSLEDDLEIWREALEKRGMEVSRTKTEYIY